MTLKEAEVGPGRMKAIRQTGAPATAPRPVKPVLEHCGIPGRDGPNYPHLWALGHRDMWDFKSGGPISPGAIFLT